MYQFLLSVGFVFNLIASIELFRKDNWLTLIFATLCAVSLYALINDDKVSQRRV